VGLCGEIISSVKVSLPADTTDPAVELTGIRIGEASLRAELDKHTALSPPSEASSAPPHAQIKVTAARKKVTPIPKAIVSISVGPAIPEGAMLITIKQAMATLSLGRTKVNELMAKGTLVRLKIDSRTLITMESVRDLANYAPDAKRAAASSGGL